MMRRLEILVFDVQDLGARPYTYVSTLRLVLETAARYGKSVIVADRPVPLPRVLDGPTRDAAHQSFVALIPAPMAYGMTPGEAALWLRARLRLDLDLRVARMRGYRRESRRGRDWPPWIPPSPGIRSWEAGQCYLATVFSEALPAIDNGRQTPMAFQVLGAPWLQSKKVCAHLNALGLRGVTFHPHAYTAAIGPWQGRLLDGLRIVVTDPVRFRPVSVSVHIIASLQELYGSRRLWSSPGRRLEFFDRLYGSDAVRHELIAGESPEAIAGSWRNALSGFKSERREHLLYKAL